MADPEDPALEPAQAGAERHVEALEDDRAHHIGVVPSGESTAVSEEEYSAGIWSRSTSSPQARTARRVASACRVWRAKTFASPSSRSMSIASFRP